MHRVLVMLGLATIVGTDAARADAGGMPVEFAISAEEFLTPGGTTLAGLPPLLIKATLEGTDSRYTLRDLELSIGGIEATGELTVDATASRPKVTGRLTSGTLDLSAMFPATAGANGPADRLFPTAELPLKVPGGFDARIELRTSTLKLPKLDLRDAEGVLALENATLSVDALRARIAGGTVEGRITLFGASDPPVAELRAIFTGIAPEQVEQVAASGTIRGALTDMTLNLRGSGQSVAGMLGSSNGEVLVSVGPGEFGKAATGASLLDAVFGVLRGFNPLSVKQDRTQLQCAVLNFRVQDGVAANPTGVAVQTDSFNVLGGGTVDLKSEQIDLAGKPRRRKKGMLGLLGVEAAVSVGGTLRKPEVTTGASVGAGTVGRVGAAWMTGGLTLIAEGMLDQLKFGDDVCTLARAPVPAR